MTVRSLAAADSGIQAMQTMLDTLGNNIANVNTVGYKQTSTQFADLLNQQLAPAGAPAPGLASTNPSAIGSGVEVSGISTNFAEGALNQTGVPSDVAITGPGFFVVHQGAQQSFTRAGNFHLDANGVLATATGGEVQGWMAGTPTSAPTTAITIAQGQAVPPVVTSAMTLAGNLPAGSTSATPIPVTATLYDSLGNQVPLDLTFTPTGTAGQWSVTGTVNGAAVNVGGSPLTFTNGQLPAAGASLTITGVPGIAGSVTANLASNGPNAVTQYAGSQSIKSANQNGSASGTLESYSIGSNGAISGTFSNGNTTTLGQIAVANFANPAGLTSLGSLSYQPSPSSGNAVIGAPGTNGTGTVLGGALEQSNVNLASQLTDLVTAQTAYQADTKVVGTTATVLQSLVNMP